MNTTVVLVRHGRSTANVAGVLAGRSEGIGLDDTGAAQAAALVDRFDGVRIAAIVSSPMQRCQETITPLAQAHGLQVVLDDGLIEVDYGTWTGRPLKDLGGEPLWKTVQSLPSAAVFPEGEGLAAMAARAVATVRGQLAAHRTTPDVPTGEDAPGDDDPEGVIVLCSHGDVIKAILADALGSHLDQFQRISVAPASISVIRYTDHRTFVDRLGDTGTLRGLGAAVPKAAPESATPEVAHQASDAVPGGDTGADHPVTAAVRD
ncbi:MAG: MSMEG_4193 family putative phosphomutase [Nakamurella sp.]